MFIIPRDRHKHQTKGTSRSARRITALIAGVILGAAVMVPSMAVAEPGPSNVKEMRALYKRPSSIPHPDTNLYTDAKMELGKQLFFDPRLSGPGTMSCATCHNPAFAWGDGLPTAIGSAANRLDRRTPTILNLAWAEALFWDGRADTLEQQAVGPIMAPGEMNQTMPRLISLLDTMPGYRSAFDKAFPGQGISSDTIAKAIATFQRTIVSGLAPFDQWINGNETAIDDKAKLGFVTFNTKARCAACHSGWRFTDDSFHDIGLPTKDLGRGNVVEGVEPLRHAFKTPSLRNVTERAPYMHNGSLSTLVAVVRHYDTGFVTRTSLSAEMHRLNLTDQEVENLVAFLKTLSSVDPAISVPALPVAEAQ